jgi:hypothetical protein
VAKKAEETKRKSQSHFRFQIFFTLRQQENKKKKLKGVPLSQIKRQQHQTQKHKTPIVFSFPFPLFSQQPNGIIPTP